MLLTLFRLTLKKFSVTVKLVYKPNFGKERTAKPLALIFSILILTISNK